MTLYEILSLLLSAAALLVGGTAHYRITKINDSNDIDGLTQSALGHGSKQAGRDINA